MDKRKYKRIKTRVLAKIDNISGILSDVSNVGLQVYTNTVPANKMAEIAFKVNDTPIKLKVMIRWIRRKLSYQHSIQIGCLILEAPPEYYQFVKEH